MAYAHSTSTTQGGIFARVSRLLQGLVEARRRQALYLVTRAELSNLSDHELADLGIHRSMINRIARDAAYAK